jgi:hypothetical protein
LRAAPSTARRSVAPHVLDDVLEFICEGICEVLCPDWHRRKKLDPDIPVPPGLTHREALAHQEIQRRIRDDPFAAERERAERKRRAERTDEQREAVRRRMRERVEAAKARRKRRGRG